MIQYIVKRVLATVLIILAVVFVVYGVVFISPGDPATTMLGMKATPETVAQLNAMLGYDKPFLVQYVNYIKNLLLNGDLGTSFQYGTSVSTEIFKRLPITLTLATLTLITQTTLALLAGVVCVRFKGKKIDNVICSLCGILTAIPSYASGLVLMLIFSVTLKLTPIYGVKTFAGYILPVCAITIGTVGYITKTVRNVLLDVMSQDYIRTARAIGENEKSVMFSYAVKNALLPIVTTIGYQFSGLLGGTVMVETVFSLNGLGSLMVNAVLGRDIPLMLGITIFTTICFCAVQLLIELSYIVLDPRVRAKYNM